MPDDLKTGIGASVKRKEDFRFLTGKGRYTDDINRPNQVYAYMLRSNIARGSLKLDISKAKSAIGVEDIIIFIICFVDSPNSRSSKWFQQFT